MNISDTVVEIARQNKCVARSLPSMIGALRTVLFAGTVAATARSSNARGARNSQHTRVASATAATALPATLAFACASAPLLSVSRPALVPAARWSPRGIAARRLSRSSLCAHTYSYSYS